jgi:hypothetical protein
MLQSCKMMTGPALALLLGASFLVGCSDGDGVAVGAAIGTVQLNWTIGGQRGPDLCARFGAAALHVVLIEDGFAVDRFEFPCEDFSTSLELLADDYAVRMTLVDAGHFRLTDRTVTTTFLLYQGEREVIDVDFPESSFFNGGSSGGNGGADAGGEAGSAGSPAPSSEGGAAAAASAGAGGAAE